MKFSYTKIPSRDPSRPWFGRPIVSVTLFHSESTTVAALVDSGADTSLFDAEIRIKFEKDHDIFEITPV